MFERLPFHVPEFLRTVWVSEAARVYWEPKIQAVSLAWSQVERATVLQGLRPGTLQSIAPEALPEMQRWCVTKALPMVIVGMEGAHGAYGNAQTPYQPGQPFTYRVYMGADPDAFFKAREDNFAVGAALGFPSCCTQFFDTWWRERGWRDLTYPAMVEKEIQNHPYSHVLLRHLGVRPVFHLPCSFACEATEQIAHNVADLMRQFGFQREATWAEALQSMPMEWSSLHGVAMVVTPLFKLVYDSDPLPSKVTYRLLSTAQPEFGASSAQFPFTMAKPLPVMRRYLNGFTSVTAMQQAHQFLLTMLKPTLAGPVLDLGCGDGTLLHAITQHCPEVTVCGVEQATVQAVVKEIPIEYVNLFDRSWDRQHYRLVLMAQQRLSEVESWQATELLQRIASHTEDFLLYSYAGWGLGIEDQLKSYFTVVRRHTDHQFEALLCESR